MLLNFKTKKCKNIHYSTVQHAAFSSEKNWFLIFSNPILCFKYEENESEMNYEKRNENKIEEEEKKAK
jgi:hypothetical protein